MNLLKPLLIISLLTSEIFCQVPNNISRVLIIINTDQFNDLSAALGSTDLYSDWYVPFLEEPWNQIYINSGMPNRIKICGLAHNTTYVTSSSGNNFANILNPAHADLGQYHALLDEYSADVLVLHCPITGGANGQADIPPLNAGLARNVAVFFAQPPNPIVFAHEFGHCHALQHCAGYRQTFDAAGTYSEAGSVWGFFTIMQYSHGVNCSNAFDGELFAGHVPAGYRMEQSFSFADPASTWTDPTTGIIYPLGSLAASGRHDTTKVTHNAWDPVIRRYLDTPPIVDIFDNMNVDEGEYAEILALNEVHLQSGFRVDQGHMRIEVGPQVLQKRGITKDVIFSGEKDEFPKESKLRGIKIISKAGVNILEINFNEESQINPDISLYDISGRLVKILTAEFSSDKSKRYNIEKVHSGAYFIKILINKKYIYKKILI